MNTSMTVSKEQTRPIPVRGPSGLLSHLIFKLRLVGDLQLKTIWQFLEPQFRSMQRGALLDVGCGEMPFRAFLPPGIAYTGIDVPEAREFSMSGDDDIHEFDGCSIPFPDAHFDYALCTEVLEHAEQPEVLVAEILRVLRPGGTLVATIPFSARVHYAPYDFQRYTLFGLRRLFATFEQVHIEPRGNDIAVIANKMIVLAARQLQPSFWLPIKLLIAIPLLATAAVFLALAHVAMWLDWGSKDDPLGYAITAKRPIKT
jgi:SAM-dependent methyltransferase